MSVPLCGRAYILAGGLSRRFGSDKALHPLDGQPLALRVAAVLAAAGFEPWLVARAPRALGLAELIEPEGPRHPLWGVGHALRDARPAALALVVPVDAVALDVGALHRLVAAAPVRAASVPLCGVFETARAEAALAAAEAGRAVRAWAEGVPELPGIEPGNLNERP